MLGLCRTVGSEPAGRHDEAHPGARRCNVRHPLDRAHARSFDRFLREPHCRGSARRLRSPGPMNALRRLWDVIALWRMQRIAARRIREMCRWDRTEDVLCRFYCALLSIREGMNSSGNAVLLATAAMGPVRRPGSSPRGVDCPQSSRLPSSREPLSGRRLTLRDINQALARLGVAVVTPRTSAELAPVA